MASKTQARAANATAIDVTTVVMSAAIAGLMIGQAVATVLRAAFV